MTWVWIVLPTEGVKRYWQNLEPEPAHVSTPLENDCDWPGWMLTPVNPGTHVVSPEGAVCVHVMLLTVLTPRFLIVMMTLLDELQNASDTSIPCV